MLQEAKNQLMVTIKTIKYGLMREMINKTSFVMNVLFMILNNASFIIQWIVIYSLREDVGGYEFNQVLPKDCTKIEGLVYNFSKANIINTMRTLPDKYLKLCSEGSSNSIILTTSREAMNNDGTWSGYYKPSSIYRRNNNMIVIDIHGSLNDNEYYTQDTIIHEMAHKFDDMMYETSFLDKLFGRSSYTNNTTEWKNCYNKYKNVSHSI